MKSVIVLSIYSPISYEKLQTSVGRLSNVTVRKSFRPKRRFTEPVSISITIPRVPFSIYNLENDESNRAQSQIKRLHLLQDALKRSTHQALKELGVKLG